MKPAAISPRFRPIGATSQTIGGTAQEIAGDLQEFPRELREVVRKAREVGGTFQITSAKPRTIGGMLPTTSSTAPGTFCADWKNDLSILPHRETAPKAQKMVKNPLGTLKTALGRRKKAAEGRRSPRRCALAMTFGWRGAFWSGPALWSFGLGWRGRWQSDASAVTAGRARARRTSPAGRKPVLNF